MEQKRNHEKITLKKKYFLKRIPSDLLVMMMNTTSAGVTPPFNPHDEDEKTKIINLLITLCRFQYIKYQRHFHKT
jgi:hypothetical protein